MSESKTTMCSDNWDLGKKEKKCFFLDTIFKMDRHCAERFNALKSNVRATKIHWKEELPSTLNFYNIVQKNLSDCCATMVNETIFEKKTLSQKEVML